jgi:hypothetical protein
MICVVISKCPVFFSCVYPLDFIVTLFRSCRDDNSAYLGTLPRVVISLLVLGIVLFHHVIVH